MNNQIEWSLKNAIFQTAWKKFVVRQEYVSFGKGGVKKISKGGGTPRDSRVYEFCTQISELFQFSMADIGGQYGPFEEKKR